MVKPKGLSTGPILYVLEHLLDQLGAFPIWGMWGRVQAARAGRVPSSFKKSTDYVPELVLDVVIEVLALRQILDMPPKIRRGIFQRRILCNSKVIYFL